MLDQKLSGPTTLIYMGSFAMTHGYGSARQTHDLDVSDLAPSTHSAELLALAQEGSALHRHFGVYIQQVTASQSGHHPLRPSGKGTYARHTHLREPDATSARSPRPRLIETRAVAGP